MNKLLIIYFYLYNLSADRGRSKEGNMELSEFYCIAVLPLDSPVNALL